MHLRKLNDSFVVNMVSCILLTSRFYYDTDSLQEFTGTQISDIHITLPKTFHEWCEVSDHKLGRYNMVMISQFMMNLLRWLLLYQFYIIEICQKDVFNPVCHASYG